MDLIKSAEGIRKVLEEYRQKNEISFEEETHSYFFKGERAKFSVSKLLKLFYKPFDSHNTKAFKDCLGNKTLESKLLNSWQRSGSFATNQGSRTHYYLEKYLVDLYGSFKEVRQPIFECDDEQVRTSDAMISAGKSFIDLMLERKCVLLDTESVLGSPELGYFGQPDKVWLTLSEKRNLGFIISDWKSNSPKNFEVQPYNNFLLPPFSEWRDYALTHYYLQLCFYGKLLKRMLKNSPYEDIHFLGGIIVLLKSDGSYQEYKVPTKIKEIILNMDIPAEIKRKKEVLDLHKLYEDRDRKLREYTTK